MRAIVLAVVLGVVGCKGGDTKAAASGPFDDILVQLEKFKTEMCACKDLACATKVTEARRDYRKVMRQKLEKGSKPSPEQDKQGKALEGELQACRKALEPAASGSGSSGAPENPVD